MGRERKGREERELGVAGGEKSSAIASERARVERVGRVAAGAISAPSRALVYRLGERTPPLLREVLTSRGWSEHDPHLHAADQWDLYWRSGRFKPSEYALASSVRRLNHFPKTTGITKKDALLRNLRRMRNIHGPVFNFFPESFILPTEYAAMVRSIEKLGARGGESRPIWIVKPTDSSQGRKIFLIRDVHEISYGHVMGGGAAAVDAPDVAQKCIIEEDFSGPKDYMSWRPQPTLDEKGRAISSDADISLTLKMLKSRLHRTVTPCAKFTEMHIAQRYIDRPFCVSGHKLDLRLYVLVASTEPLRIYLHDDCLLRFATQRYDLSDLDNQYSHLTNSSINKHSDSLESNKEGIGVGCKFSFRHWLRDNPNSPLSSPLLWARIRAIICLTLLSIAAEVPDSGGCFELLGYDIIVDEDLRPWLLEVNTSPALSIDCDADRLVKEGLIVDLLDVLALQREQSAHTEHTHARAASAGSDGPRVRSRRVGRSCSKADELQPDRRTPAGGGAAAVRLRGRSAPRGGRRKDNAMPQQFPQRVGGYELILPFNGASVALIEEGVGGNEGALIGAIKMELQRAKGPLDGGSTGENGSINQGTEADARTPNMGIATPGDAMSKAKSAQPRDGTSLVASHEDQMGASALGSSADTTRQERTPLCKVTGSVETNSMGVPETCPSFHSVAMPRRQSN